MLIPSFIILALIILIIIMLNYQENFVSNLDIYYPNKFENQKPDICGECGVLCQYCKHGKINPQTCNNPFNNLKQGYLNPQSNNGQIMVDPELTSSPDAFKCIDDEVMKNLISANYVYIYSDAFSKALAFETYGNKSNVFIDPKLPSANDCLTTDQYNNECKRYENDVIPYPSFDKHLPQKWRIDVKTHNPNVCLVTISSYSCNGLKYYLTANKDGKVTTSLFGGSNDQVWQIYTKPIDKNNINIFIPELEQNEYLIKSYLYCTYLSGTNDGYLKRNAGNVSLTNISSGNIGKENLWKIKTCGMRKFGSKPLKQKYKPMMSTLDYPTVDDNIGPKDVAPKDLKLSKNVNQKWFGRSVWIPQFDKVWNGKYNFEQYYKDNKLVEIKDNNSDKIRFNKDGKPVLKNYKIVSQNIPANGYFEIKMDNNDNYDTQRTGNVCLYDIITVKPETKQVTGNLYNGFGLEKRGIFTYIVNNITKIKKCYKIKSSGAGTFYGKSDDGNEKIFLEYDQGKSDKNKIVITLSNKNGDIIKRIIGNKN